MLDRPLSRLTAQIPPALPVADLVRGKPAEEVVELLPRLFNLCRAAQRVAVRGALGLPVTAEDLSGITDEIRRDHQGKLGVFLPLAFGLPAGEAPTAFPASPDGFKRYLRSDAPFADLLRQVVRNFPAGAATVPVLRAPDAGSLFWAVAQENSVAARVMDDPVMRFVEAEFGRGPLWRVVSRAVELRRIEEGWQPGLIVAGGGVIVPAARGAYAVRAAVSGGRVDALHRVTPTDHLLASGGILEASLATLTDLEAAPRLLAVLDPCVPVTLKEARTDA